jgi:hypothetical protein
LLRRADHDRDHGWTVTVKTQMPRQAVTPLIPAELSWRVMAR